MIDYQDQLLSRLHPDLVVKLDLIFSRKGRRIVVLGQIVDPKALNCRTSFILDIPRPPARIVQHVLQIGGLTRIVIHTGTVYRQRKRLLTFYAKLERAKKPIFQSKVWQRMFFGKCTRFLGSLLMSPTYDQIARRRLRDFPCPVKLQLSVLPNFIL